MKLKTMGYLLKKGLVILLFLPFILISCKKDNRALVVGKIHKASKLATTEFTIDKIVHGTKKKKLGWLITLNEARMLVHSKALIKAGIDLEKLTKEDIKIEDGSISLILPPIEVLNFSYPPDSFRMDNQISRNKFLNKISVTDQEEFFRRAELDIRNNLEYMGIVETTQDKTRSMLNLMLKSLGYKEIYIEFENDKLIIDKVPQDEEAL